MFHKYGTALLKIALAGITIAAVIVSIATTLPLLAILLATLFALAMVLGLFAVAKKTFDLFAHQDRVSKERIRRAESRISEQESVIAALKNELSRSQRETTEHFDRISETQNDLKEKTNEYDSRLTGIDRGLVDNNNQLAGVSDNINNIRTEASNLSDKVSRLSSKNFALHKQVIGFRKSYQEGRITNRKEIQTLSKKVLSIHRSFASTTEIQSSFFDALTKDITESEVTENSSIGNLFEAQFHNLLASSKPERALYLLPRAPFLLNTLSRTELRQVARTLRNLGFLDKATELAERLYQDTSLESDAQRVALWQAELDFERDPDSVLRSPESEPIVNHDSAVVIHVVAHGLPEKQTGYTLRTHNTAKAQAELGYKPIIAVQGGVDEMDAQEYELDGIKYIKLDAPSKSSVSRGDWIQGNIDSLHEVVKSYKPALVQPHSDYLNSIIARHACKSLGIPVIYEQRGFWEDSWWSRVAEATPERKQFMEAMPLPEAYSLRTEREAHERATVDKVITLAGVMAEHCVSQNEEHQVPAFVPAVVPNAVDADRFANLETDTKLLADLDISGPVIGYISSMVPYEGIDVLAKAFLSLKNLITNVRDNGSLEFDDLELTDANFESGLSETEKEAFIKNVKALADKEDPTLILVGEGRSATALQNEIGSDRGVRFLGRVPNEEITRYYSIIDLFVVPRLPFPVCELVTPLKPFEAFASGRTVLMSDVRALAEIAEESQGALTFRAGDSSDLMVKMAHLLSHPEEASKLAQAGQAWVREERTWSKNAALYDRIYKDLCDIPEVDTHALSKDTRDLFESIDVTPAHAVSKLNALSRPRGLGWFAVARSRQSAQDIIDNGWNAPGFGNVDWRSLGWDAACASNRSASHHLHAWDLVQSAMTEYSDEPNPALLSWLLDIAESWVKEMPEEHDQSSMAWYDMSLSIRLGRLTRVIRWAVADGEVARGLNLLPALIKHIEMLQEPKAFNKRNNHGVFAAIAAIDVHMYFSPIIPTDDVFKQGIERLELMTTSQFAPDGGHTEHSPAYHRMLLGSFISAARDGLVADPDLLERLSKATEVLGWFVQPNGEMLQFGDSDAARPPELDDSEITSEHSKFILSRGKNGVPNEKEMIALPDSGYAIVRSPQPQSASDFGHESYLALTAGFHSRAHKHADDLSLVWTHEGHEILIDSGRFGYIDLLPADDPARSDGFYYSRPERQYVESTRSHNTISVDGKNHDRKQRKPYGSGILSAEQSISGSFEIEAEAPHSFGSHHRHILFNPGKLLEIQDVVKTDGEASTVTAWFNFDGELELIDSDDHIEITIPTTGEIIRVTSNATLVSMDKGAEDPLAGWRSKRSLEFEPAWNVGFEVSTVDLRRARITTRFEVL